MPTLHSTTIRRLLKLPQSNAVWEGDRRSLHPFEEEEQDAREHKDCIIWVDSLEGMVRGMEMVSPQAGMEAVVRTLLRAMEVPQGYGKACRPQKVVVRDREIQFFLRGVLRELDIKIDYQAELPLIEALFQGLAETNDDRPPLLPAAYAQPLLKTAHDIWQHSPWEFLDDSEIITIEFQDWDIDPLYISVMGMLGAEYGILLYRSFDSLKTFRSQMFQGESMEDLETAFLQQDCWFLNYDLPEEAEEADDLTDIKPDPHFGSVNPYEGLRPYFGEDEAAVVYVALQALQRFTKRNQSQLETEFESKIKTRYKIELPKPIKEKTPIVVTVATNPDLETELIDLLDSEEGEEVNTSEDVEFYSPIKEDLVPQDSFLSIGMISWEMIAEMRKNDKQFYQSLGITKKGDGMPIILIQTSRPKAQAMIEQIQHSGGVSGIGFNSGEDPIAETVYDLGILQTGDGELYLFGEFEESDPTHRKARQQWEKRCQQTQGYCGLLIARGFKGASKGQPQLRDMMALFEAKALSAEELGLGVLQLIE